MDNMMDDEDDHYASLDLYDDLITDEGQTRQDNYDELSRKYDAAVLKIGELESEVNTLRKSESNLTEKCEILEKNISTLFLTARLELQRKDRTIQQFKLKSEPRNQARIASATNPRLNRIDRRNHWEQSENKKLSGPIVVDKGKTKRRLSSDDREEKIKKKRKFSDKAGNRGAENVSKCDVSRTDNCGQNAARKILDKSKKDIQRRLSGGKSSTHLDDAYDENMDREQKKRNREDRCSANDLRKVEKNDRQEKKRKNAVENEKRDETKRKSKLTETTTEKVHLVEENMNKKSASDRVCDLREKLKTKRLKKEDNFKNVSLLESKGNTCNISKVDSRSHSPATDERLLSSAKEKMKSRGEISSPKDTNCHSRTSKNRSRNRLSEDKSSPRLALLPKSCDGKVSDHELPTDYLSPISKPKLDCGKQVNPNRRPVIDVKSNIDPDRLNSRSTDQQGVFASNKLCTDKILQKPSHPVMHVKKACSLETPSPDKFINGIEKCSSPTVKDVWTTGSENTSSFLPHYERTNETCSTLKKFQKDSADNLDPSLLSSPEIDVENLSSTTIESVETIQTRGNQKNAQTTGKAQETSTVLISEVMLGSSLEESTPRNSGESSLPASNVLKDNDTKNPSVPEMSDGKKKATSTLSNGRTGASKESTLPVDSSKRGRHHSKGKLSEKEKTAQDTASYKTSQTKPVDHEVKEEPDNRQTDTSYVTNKASQKHEVNVIKNHAGQRLEKKLGNSPKLDVDELKKTIKTDPEANNLQSDQNQRKKHNSAEDTRTSKQNVRAPLSPRNVKQTSTRLKDRVKIKSERISSSPAGKSREKLELNATDVSATPSKQRHLLQVNQNDLKMPTEAKSQINVSPGSKENASMSVSFVSDRQENHSHGQLAKLEKLVHKPNTDRNKVSAMEEDLIVIQTKRVVAENDDHLYDQESEKNKEKPGSESTDQLEHEQSDTILKQTVHKQQISESVVSKGHARDITGSQMESNLTPVAEYCESTEIRLPEMSTGDYSTQEMDSEPCGTQKKDPGFCGMEELDSGSYGKEKLDTKSHGVEKLDIEVCGKDKLDTKSHGVEKLDTEVCGTEKLDIEVCGTEKLDIEVCGKEKLDTKSNGTDKLDTQSHGIAKTDTQSHRTAKTDPQSHGKAKTDTQSREKEKTDTLSHRTAKTDPQSHEKTKTDTQSHGTAKTDTLSHGKAQTDTQSHGTAKTDTQSRGAAKTDTQSHGKGKTDTLSHEKEKTDTLSHEKEKTDTQSHGKTKTDTQSHGPEKTDTQSHGTANVATELHGMEKLDTETFGMEKLVDVEMDENEMSAIDEECSKTLPHSNEESKECPVKSSKRQMDLNDFGKERLLNADNLLNQVKDVEDDLTVNRKRSASSVQTDSTLESDLDMSSDSEAEEKSDVINSYSSCEENQNTDSETFCSSDMKSNASHQDQVQHKLNSVVVHTSESGSDGDAGDQFSADGFWCRSPKQDGSHQTPKQVKSGLLTQSGEVTGAQMNKPIGSPLPKQTDLQASDRNEDIYKEDLDYEYESDSSSLCSGLGDDESSGNVSGPLQRNDENLTEEFSELDTGVEDLQTDELMLCVSPSESMEFDTEENTEKDVDKTVKTKKLISPKKKILHSRSKREDDRTLSKKDVLSSEISNQKRDLHKQRERKPSQEHSRSLHPRENDRNRSSKSNGLDHHSKRSSECYGRNLGDEIIRSSRHHHCEERGLKERERKGKMSEQKKGDERRDKSHPHDSPRISKDREKKRSSKDRDNDRERKSKDCHSDKERISKDRHSDTEKTLKSHHSDKERTIKDHHDDMERTSKDRHSDTERTHKDRHIDMEKFSKDRHSDTERTTRDRHSDKQQTPKDRNGNKERTAKNGCSDTERISKGRHSDIKRNSQDRHSDMKKTTKDRHSDTERTNKDHHSDKYRERLSRDHLCDKDRLSRGKEKKFKEQLNVEEKTSKDQLSEKTRTLKNNQCGKERTAKDNHDEKVGISKVCQSHRESSEKERNLSSKYGRTSEKKVVMVKTARNLEDKYESPKILRTVTSETIFSAEDSHLVTDTMELYDEHKPDCVDNPSLQSVGHTTICHSDMHGVGNTDPQGYISDHSKKRDVSHMILADKLSTRTYETSLNNIVNITRTDSDDEDMEIRVTDSSNNSCSEDLLSDVSEPEKCARVRTWQEVAKIFRENVDVIDVEEVRMEPDVEERSDNDNSDSESSSSSSSSSGDDEESDNSCYGMDSNFTFELCKNSDTISEGEDDGKCTSVDARGESICENTIKNTDLCLPNPPEMYNDNATDNFTDSFDDRFHNCPTSIPKKCVLNEESLEEGEILTDSEEKVETVSNDINSRKLSSREKTRPSHGKIVNKTDKHGSVQNIVKSHHLGNRTDKRSSERPLISPRPSPRKGKSPRDEMYRRKHVQTAVKVLRNRSRERKSYPVTGTSPVKVQRHGGSRNIDRTDLRNRIGDLSTRGLEDKLPLRKRKRSRSCERGSRVKCVSPRRS